MKNIKIVGKIWNFNKKYDIIFRNSSYKVNFSGCDDLDYKFNAEKIGDGLELCCVKAENFKSAVISLTFTLPLSQKASLFALVPCILTRSTNKYPSVTLLERKCASLYGADISADVTKTGENQVIKLGISCIDDRFALDNESITSECARLLFEIAFNPHFVDGQFVPDEAESEKRILKEQLDGEKSDKRVYAKNRCEEIMFKDELYGINKYGAAEDIEKITPEALTKAYFELLEKSFISVCVSGGSNIDTNEIKALLFDYFKGVNRDPEIQETLFVESAEDVQYEKETENVKQGKLVLGFRTGMKNAEDNYGDRRVMTDLFGGNPHSKLFTVVREKMSLCYYCSARMYAKKGYMLVQSGIETYNEEKAKTAILAQLEEIKNGNFTDEDINSSKKALADSFKSVSDSPEALETWFMSQSSSGKYLYPEDYIEMFNNVTREGIISAAKDVTLDTVFMLAGNAENAEDR